MQPRPLPKKFEKVWLKWPTFDDLRTQNGELKVHQIRDALRDVPCYRCPDQSARYMPDRAADHLARLKLEPVSAAAGDEDDDDGDSSPLDELAEPKTYDGLVLFRQGMLIVSDLRKSLGDLADSMTKAIGQMTKPMELGLQLVREQNQMMSERLKHYEGVSDRMQQVCESLLSEQQAREIALMREKAAAETRKKIFEGAQQYLPTLVERFRPVSEATAALEAVRTLEPEVLDAIVEGADMTPEQKTAWTKIRDVLRTKQPPHEHANSDGTNHAPSPPS